MYFDKEFFLDRAYVSTRDALNELRELEDDETSNSPRGAFLSYNAVPLLSFIETVKLPFTIVSSIRAGKRSDVTDVE